MKKRTHKLNISVISGICLSIALAIVMTVPVSAAVTEDSSHGPAFASQQHAESYFDGEELRMLANQTESQMNSFVITTKNGSVIVVDGGTAGDSAHLRQVLAEKGNHVNAWFITHPHSDHAGALAQIIEEGLQGLTIDNIYYHFADQDWINQNEAYRADFVARLSNDLAGLGAVPKVMHKGDQYVIDTAAVTVMNDPYLCSSNSINNNSVVLKTVLGPKIIMFLGDLDTNVQGAWLADHAGEDLHCDIVQLSHHGQRGVNEDFYKVLQPKTALWCAPGWLYDDASGTYQTKDTKAWLRNLKVKDHFCIKDGDQILR